MLLGKKKTETPIFQGISVVLPKLYLGGRSDRSRTCGILLPKQARYQLRYTPRLLNIRWENTMLADYIKFFL